MKLIADAGSTKTDWRLINSEGIVIGTFESGGLNPVVFDDDTLKMNLARSGELFDFVNSISEVHLYGAGTDEPNAQARLHDILSKVFDRAEIYINDDLLAAARATAGKEPALVVILGTGSNSGYYDGKRIRKTIGHLGYVLMDDASGNWFGRQMIRDYYFEKMPQLLRRKFKAKFNLDDKYLKTHIYQSDQPNTFLAQYSLFMHENYDERYIKKLLLKGFVQFMENEMHAYRQYKEDLPVHFAGSIGFFYQKELREAVKSTGWKLGKIIRKPLDYLINYHLI
jgi:N-acetylglucosamine kinase-like BadF-type ATPase